MYRSIVEKYSGVRMPTCTNPPTFVSNTYFPPRMAIFGDWGWNWDKNDSSFGKGAFSWRSVKDSASVKEMWHVM
jgi:hypothetical protein